VFWDALSPLRPLLLQAVALAVALQEEATRLPITLECVVVSVDVYLFIYFGQDFFFF